jgi:hypothetical protein
MQHIILGKKYKHCSVYDLSGKNLKVFCFW